MIERARSRMLDEGIWKLIGRYSVPSVASMVGVSMYILADTYFIANGIGEMALAALNICLPIYALLACIGNMVGIGGATIFAISREVGDRRTFRDVFSLCMAAVLAGGAFFFLIGAFAARPFVTLMGASEETMPYALIYAKVLLISAPVFLINNVLTAFVRNDGRPNLAMTSMLSAVVFNIIFDYIFIYIFNWGMFGAILATCLAPVLGISILCVHFLDGHNTFKLHRFKPSPTMLLRVIRGGAATFVTELAYGIVVFGFNYKLLALAGDIGVAAFGIISNLAYVVLAIFNGIGQGLQPIVSANYGAQRHERCREILKKGSILAAAVSVLIVVTVLLAPEWISDAFNRDNNPELTRHAVPGLRLYFTSFLLTGVNIVMIAYYQAMLKSVVAISISLARGFFGILIGLWLLPPLLGVAGIWLTAPFAELTASAVAKIAGKNLGLRPNPPGDSVPRTPGL